MKNLQLQKGIQFPLYPWVTIRPLIKQNVKQRQPDNEANIIIPAWHAHNQREDDSVVLWVWWCHPLTLCHVSPLSSPKHSATIIRYCEK